jgi:hypothetical protein
VNDALDYDRMVPVDELHCPTCGEPMDLESVWRCSEPPEPIYTDSVEPAAFLETRQMALECEAGHRWSVKATGHSIEGGERCLLGDYLGRFA